jgi:endonuclease/exonuclease/phosphatase family metal-dependent hydrolase
MQVKKILRYLERIPARDAVILAGDFNDWASRLGATFTAHEFMEHSQKTFPSWLPLLPLDRIYTRNIQVQAFHSFTGAPWRGLSDHLPLAIDFSWSPGQRT